MKYDYHTGYLPEETKKKSSKAVYIFSVLLIVLAIFLIYMWGYYE